MLAYYKGISLLILLFIIAYPQNSIMAKFKRMFKKKTISCEVTESEGSRLYKATFTYGEKVYSATCECLHHVFM